METNIQLESEKIILRPIQLEDLAAFGQITSPPELWRFFTMDLSISSELKNWLDMALSEQQSKKRIPFTVVEKSSERIIGSTSIGNISEHDQRAEIGWTWLGRDFQGKGINNHMKYMMMQYIFETLNFERVEFKTDVLNTFSRAALKRIGATEEGILRSHMLMTHNRRRDSLYYSVLKAEWEGVKAKLSELL